MKHKWKHVISFDGETTENFIVCDECGAEMDDDNEESDCEEDADV